jgi:hypothetical protein
MHESEAVASFVRTTASFQESPVVEDTHENADIAKDQRDGFELVEVLQINQSYLVLQEKSVSKKGP